MHAHETRPTWPGWILLGLVLGACSGPAVSARPDDAAPVSPPSVPRADTPQAWRAEVVAALDEGRLADALAAIDHVLTLAPDEAQGHAMRAVLLTLQERQEEAAGSWRAALERDPERNDWRYHQLQALFATGDFGEAAEVYEDLVASDLAPLDASASNPLGPDRQSWTEAVVRHPLEDDGFQGWTWLPPGRVSGLKNAHDLGGWAFLYTGQLAAALRAFDRMRDYVPWDYRGLEGAGWALHLLGREEEAAVAFGHARELEPDVARLRHELGQEQLERGRADAARLCFELAQALDPRQSPPGESFGQH
jgi:tetratricopeptide (TPR) repeat protein